MNSRVKKIFGTALASGLAAFNLCAQSAAAFGNLPLWFENSDTAKFIAHGSSSEFIISPGGTEFTLEKSSGETASCTLQFTGTTATPHISGDQPLAGKVSHFTGNQPAQWQVGQPTFARVRVENVYPGVNVVYYGNQNTLEYDFNLAAGINPAVIGLHFAGAEKISLDPQGALVIKVNAGEIVQHAPVAYQMLGGTRQEVAAGYKILDAHTAAFTLGDFDHSQPLVIDPVLTYSTYFGGNLGDTAWAIAVNPTDNSIYVAGSTFSSKTTNGIPFCTPGGFQTNFDGGKQAGDAFVARFDSTGTNLMYATYFGGVSDDSAYALAVDAAGYAFVAGATISSNFPIKNPIPSGNKIHGPFDKDRQKYQTDAFVAELDPSGSNLVYSTYIGGNSAEAAYGIALDSSDNAYITGFTYSTNFPVTPDAYQASLQCSNTVYVNANAFVTVVAAGGGSLVYSTFLGGTNKDIGRAIAYNNNKVFVAGYTYSTNFPATNFLAQFKYLNGNPRTNKKKKINGASDAFVTAFDASNMSTPLYSTLLGGTNNDVANGIAADAAGSAYVAGYTTSTNFPYINAIPYTNALGRITNSLSFVHTNIGNQYQLATNGFLTKITWDGSQTAIGYSVMFGRKGVNVANGVALDPDGNAYIVGSANCTNFPVTITNADIYGGLSATNRSRKVNDRKLSDVIVIAFNTDCSALLYSAYLGGRDNDFGNAIALDASNNVYIAGVTFSTNLPTMDPYQPYRSGSNDMFIAKISMDESTNSIVPAIVIAPNLSIALDNDNSTTPLVHANVSGLPASTPAHPIVLKWKKSVADYDVESSTDMTSGNWKIVPQNAIYTNGCYQISLPTTNGVQFFRLRQH